VLKKSTDALIAKTEADGYTEKVPENVRNENAERIARQLEELKSIETARANFESLL